MTFNRSCIHDILLNTAVTSMFFQSKVWKVQIFVCKWMYSIKVKGHQKKKKENTPAQIPEKCTLIQCQGICYLPPLGNTRLSKGGPAAVIRSFLHLLPAEKKHNAGRDDANIGKQIERRLTSDVFTQPAGIKGAPSPMNHRIISHVWKVEKSTGFCCLLSRCGGWGHTGATIIQERKVWRRAGSRSISGWVTGYYGAAHWKIPRKSLSPPSGHQWWDEKWWREPSAGAGDLFPRGIFCVGLDLKLTRADKMKRNQLKVCF